MGVKAGIFILLLTHLCVCFAQNQQFQHHGGGTAREHAPPQVTPHFSGGTNTQPQGASRRSGASGHPYHNGAVIIYGSGYLYDQANEPVEQDTTAATNTVYTTSDANGNLIYYTYDENGNIVYFTYDENGNIVYLDEENE